MKSPVIIFVDFFFHFVNLSSSPPFCINYLAKYDMSQNSKFIHGNSLGSTLFQYQSEGQCQLILTSTREGPGGEHHFTRI